MVSLVNPSKIMEKLNKLSLPATILIASLVLGGFYYASQASKQKSIEKQQQIEIEQKKQEQFGKELKEQQIKEESEQALNTCISNAESAYSNAWYRECKSSGKLSNKCIDIHELTFTEYLDKYGITEDEYKTQRNITDTNTFSARFDYLGRRDDECSCRLPLDNADRINEMLKDDKDACYR